MRIRLLLLPALGLTLLAGWGIPHLVAYQPVSPLTIPGDIPEEFHAHVLGLSFENCAIDLDIRETPTDPKVQEALESCAQRELQAFRGNTELVRQALVRKILEVGNKRTAKDIPNMLSNSDKKNFFLQLTQEDARVLYHDLVNCYFTIATEVAVDFYLDRAMGVADTDAPADTKMTKREYYQVPELPENYCHAVYDSAPLLAATYPNRMTDFEKTLRTSVKESQNKETNMGFTSIIGHFALEDVEAYLQFLDTIRAYPLESHLLSGTEERNGFRSFAYQPSQLTAREVQAQATNAERRVELAYDAVEHNLKAALRAFQGFERTFPIHLQYKKIQHVSERLAKRVQHLRLAWKFLNVKFTNASIEGGAK